MEVYLLWVYLWKALRAFFGSSPFGAPQSGVTSGPSAHPMSNIMFLDHALLGPMINIKFFDQATMNSRCAFDAFVCNGSVPGSFGTYSVYYTLNGLHRWGVSSLPWRTSSSRQSTRKMFNNISHCLQNNPFIKRDLGEIAIHFFFTALGNKTKTISSYQNVSRDGSSFETENCFGWDTA